MASSTDYVIENISERNSETPTISPSPPPPAYALARNKLGRPVLYEQADMTEAFVWPTVIMKCFGILPSNDNGSSQHNSRDNRPFTSRVFVSPGCWGTRFGLNVVNTVVVGIVLVSTCSSAGLVLHSNLSRFDTPTIFNISLFIWSSQQALVAITISYVWRRPLKQLLEEWNEDTTLCARGPHSRKLKRLGKWLFASATAFASVNAVFMAAFLQKSMPGSDYLLKYDDYFGHPTVNLVAKIVLSVGLPLNCFYWCFVCSFIALVGYGLAMEFENIAEVIEANYDKELQILNIDLKVVRTWHQNICYLVRKADDSFHFIIAIIFCSDLLSMVLLIYEIFIGDNVDVTIKSIAGTWLCGATFQWLIICVVGSLLHERAHRPLRTLFDISAKVSDAAESRLELALFTSRLSSGGRIGLSAWRFLVISRDTILSIIAGLLTLILVIIDLANG